MPEPLPSSNYSSFPNLLNKNAYQSQINNIPTQQNNYFMDKPSLSDPNLLHSHSNKYSSALESLESLFEKMDLFKETTNNQQHTNNMNNHHHENRNVIPPHHHNHSNSQSALL